VSGLSEARIPRAIDDPAVRAALLAEYAFAERLRAAIIGWAAVVVATLFALLAALASLGVPIPVPPSRPAVAVALGAGTLLASVQYVAADRATRFADERARTLFWYGSTVFEVGVIVGAWLAVDALSGGVLTLFPGLVSYAALVVLSALRLEWRLTVFTAMLAAASHVLLHWQLGAGDIAAGFRPRAFEGATSLLVIGALSALVAEQSRRRTVQALRAIKEKQRFERDILDAEDAARAQLGRDLHDGLGGRLTGLALMAQGLARRAEAGATLPPPALRQVADLALEGVDEVRRLARGLDPAPVELGLAEAMRRMAERTTAAGTPCTFAFEGEVQDIEAAATRQLYHIAHEALANALRHGRPSEIGLRLTVRPATVALDVRDDGIGIADSPTPGLGLRTMAQRAALLGAVLRVRPGPNGGTVVSCIVPNPLSGDSL
jgi:signal transduction histidine kinase